MFSNRLPIIQMKYEHIPANLLKFYWNEKMYQKTINMFVI